MLMTDAGEGWQYSFEIPKDDMEGTGAVDGFFVECVKEDESPSP